MSVVLEYPKPCLARTSVLDKQRNRLVSRLIGGGICQKNSVSYVLFVRIVILSSPYAVLDVFFVQIVSSLVLFYDG